MDSSINIQGQYLKGTKYSRKHDESVIAEYVESIECDSCGRKSPCCSFDNSLGEYPGLNICASCLLKVATCFL